jgi:hypothetical protein
MRRDGETIQDYALRRTWLLIKSDIPAKHVISFKAYIDGLSEDELANYTQIANDLYDRRTIGAKSVKVTLNAIKLCVKLSLHGYKTFPYIQQLATKGWGTDGGSYSFSMPLLTDDMVNREIFCFGPIENLVKKNAQLDVGYSEHRRVLEVDYK